MAKHKVKKGESYWSIAKKYTKSPLQYTKLIELNKIPSNRLKIGLEIEIPDEWVEIPEGVKGSESNPILLPDVDVVYTKKKKSNSSQSWWDKYVNTSYVQELLRTDPVIGDRRVELVGKYYGENNPFRQANDAVGNAIIDAAATAAGAKGVNTAWNLLRTLGMKALPTILAGIGGAMTGSELVDTGLESATGLNWALLADRAGMDSYGQVVTNPGGWAGSWLGSTLSNTAVNNFATTLQNNYPRMAMTPEGPVMLEPGQTYTSVSRPVIYQNGTQGTSRYSARYTGKPSGARGSSAGLGNHPTSTSGNAVGHRIMFDVNTGKNGSGYTFSNPYSEYVGFLPGYSIPWGNYYTSKSVPEEVPIPAEDLGIRYEQYTNPDDAFLEWYGKLPEGTTQTYSGDQYHPAGAYTIIRTLPDPQRTVRRVGNELGYIARDSTTMIPRKLPAVTNELLGRVDPRAVLLSEKLKGF